MLSLKENGIPLAYFKKYGKVGTVDYLENIHVSNIDNQCDKTMYITERDLADMTRSYIPTEYLRHIRKAIFDINGDKMVRDMDEKCLKLYQKAKFTLNDRIPKEIHINSKLRPIPFYNNDSEKQRLSVCAAGPSGSGKSYAIALLIKDLVKIYPKLKKRIFYYSRNMNKDPAYKNLDIKIIKLDEDYKEDPLPLEYFKNSIVIFDDIETIPDKKIKALVKDIRSDILECGRHLNINVFSTTHSLSGKESKDLMNECNSILFFPQSGLSGSIQKVLNVYGCLSNKNIKRLLNLNTRYIYFHTKHPMYIVTDYSVILI